MQCHRLLDRPGTNGIMIVRASASTSAPFLPNRYAFRLNMYRFRHNLCTFLENCILFALCEN